MAGLDAILRVPGIDMVYIGPNDLALALGERPGAELKAGATSEAIAEILAKASEAGVPAGIFCNDGDLARQRLAEGFALVTPGNDFAQAMSAMAEAIDKPLAP